MVENTDYEIDLMELARSLFRHKKKGVAIIFLSVLFFVVISFMVTPTYQAQIIMSPASPDNDPISKNLGSLSSFIDIGGSGTTDESSVNMATLMSRKLSREFILENNLMPILYENQWDKEKKEWLETPPSLWRAVTRFDKRVRMVSTNKENGIITLSMNWKDPAIASEWVEKFINKVNKVLKDQHIDTSNTNRNFLELQINGTDNNEMRNMLFSLIQEEMKKEMLANNGNEFAYKIIDPAIVPEDPIKPNKILYVLFGLIFGFLFFVFLIIYLERQKKKDT